MIKIIIGKYGISEEPAKEFFFGTIRAFLDFFVYENKRRGIPCRVEDFSKIDLTSSEDLKNSVLAECLNTKGEIDFKELANFIRKSKNYKKFEKSIKFPFNHSILPFLKERKIIVVDNRHWVVPKAQAKFDECFIVEILRDSFVSDEEKLEVIRGFKK